MRGAWTGLAAVVIAGATAQAQQPPAAPGADEDADVLFVERLNDFIQSYLSDAPAQAREFQEAVRQFQTEQAAAHFKALNLPKQAGPLTPEQQKALEKIEVRYRDTEGARMATERLREHFRLLDEPKAQEALKAIGLKGNEQSLTPEQVTALNQLREQYPLSQAAHVAAATMARIRQSEARQAFHKLIHEYMQTPGANEALERFLDRRLEFATSTVESQQRIRLEDLIRNFPESAAAARAKPILAGIEARISQRVAKSAADAHRSALYRAYWDARYPERLRTAPPPQTPVRESEGKEPSTPVLIP